MRVCRVLERSGNELEWRKSASAQTLFMLRHLVGSGCRQGTRAWVDDRRKRFGDIRAREFDLNQALSWPRDILNLLISAYPLIASSASHCYGFIEN
jgi:hypothetical protein